MAASIEATNAYLEPLLKKHEAGEALVWEDLENSYAKTKATVESGDLVASVRMLLSP